MGTTIPPLSSVDIDTCNAFDLIYYMKANKFEFRVTTDLSIIEKLRFGNNAPKYRAAFYKGQYGYLEYGNSLEDLIRQAAKSALNGERVRSMLGIF